MGEDVDLNSRLFELPANGNAILPPEESLELNELPEAVIEQVRFEENMQELSTVRQMNKPKVMDFGSAGKAYIVADYCERDIGTFSKFYVVNEIDISTDGNLMGGGLSFLELDENGVETDDPYVQFSFTKPGYERQGLGLRRLIILNEINKKLFHRNLTSGSFIEPNIEALWQRLEQAGLAEKIEENHYRFR
jgi:hypothetical protein